MAAFVHFRDGASIEEVMQRMSRARSTVMQYLLEYVRHERVMEADAWLEEGVVDRVEAALEAVGATALRPIFDQLGGAVPYDDIRIAAACLANRDNA